MKKWKSYEFTRPEFLMIYACVMFVLVLVTVINDPPEISGPGMSTTEMAVGYLVAKTIIGF